MSEGVASKRKGKRMQSRGGYEVVCVLFEEAFTDGEEFPVALIVHLSYVRFLAGVFSRVFADEML